MKLACRATIICAYLSLLITSTFEDFAFLMAFSSPERPAPGSWNHLKPQPWTVPPHPGPRMQTLITYGDGPTLTTVKGLSLHQHPPRPVPPLLRSSRVYPRHPLIQPAKICIPFLPWRLLHLKTRPDRLQPLSGILTIQLEQKEVIIPVLLRTARLLRASASRCNPTKMIVEFALFCTRFLRYTTPNYNFPLCKHLSLNPFCASCG